MAQRSRLQAALALAVDQKQYTKAADLQTELINLTRPPFMLYVSVSFGASTYLAALDYSCVIRTLMLSSIGASDRWPRQWHQCHFEQFENMTAEEMATATPQTGRSNSFALQARLLGLNRKNYVMTIVLCKHVVFRWRWIQRWKRFWIQSQWSILNDIFILESKQSPRPSCQSRILRRHRLRRWVPTRKLIGQVSICAIIKFGKTTALCTHVFLYQKTRIKS